MGKAILYSSTAEVSGRVTHHILVCSKCGACVTITHKQRKDGTSWLYYLDEVLDCCASPYYYYGDFRRFYTNR